VGRDPLPGYPANRPANPLGLGRTRSSETDGLWDMPGRARRLAQSPAAVTSVIVAGTVPHRGIAHGTQGISSLPERPKPSYDGSSPPRAEP